MAQIIVLSTKTQKKYTLDVQGNTLADLKAVMQNNGIDYNGMTFFEGRTKTELLSDQSQFPENAIIRLTKSEKKITSGAELVTRQDAYAAIKANNLALAIQKKFGKNFTQCKTQDLLDFIKKTTKVSTPKVAEVAEVSETSKSPKVECSCATSKEAWIQSGLNNGYIDNETAIQLRNSVKVESISKEDLDMFNF